MIRLFLMLLVGMLPPLSLHAQPPESSLVLVASVQSAIKQLSPAEARKLYLGVPMIVGAAVREMLAVTNAMYGADSDFTSMCRVIESWAGAEVRG